MLVRPSPARRSSTITRRLIGIAAAVALGSTITLGQTSAGSQKIIDSNPRDAAAVKDAQQGWWKDAQRTVDQRIGWWRDARFGCFIHFGPSSAFGGEWKGKNVGGYSEHMMRTQRIPLAEYKQDVVAPFDPEQYDADAWVKLIKAAGMRYVIFTAKHHDGFAMWPSDAYPYDIRLTAFFKKTGRDPLGELSAACHREGLKFGMYYSQSWDWEHPDSQGNNWDYPVLADTMNIFVDKWQPKYDAVGDQCEKYIDGKVIPQLKELIAKYHPDTLWFDTPRLMPPYLQLKVVKAVREAGPGILVNGRATSRPLMNYGDYDDTGDRPAETRAYPGDWQGIPTCNDSYGYHKLDNSYKPAGHFIQLIAKLAAKGGNTLLNIGPMGDGRVDPQSAAILAGVGKWMDVNAESIRGTQRTPLDRQAWGDSTLKGDTLYLHVFDWPKDGKLVVGGLTTTPTAACLLADAGKTPLKCERANDKDVSIQLPAAAPEKDDSVVVLTFAAPPQTVAGRLLATNVPANRLLAFDGTLPKAGVAFTYGDGKRNNYWVSGFTDTTRTLTWNARLNAPATFKVNLKCSVSTPADGGTFTLKVGDKELTGTVDSAAPQKATLTDAGQEAVGPASARGAGTATTVRTIDLGTVTLPAGDAPIFFRPDQVNGRGINVFEVNLIPEDAS